MKTNIIKRFITIAAAVTLTFAITAGAVHAQGSVPLPNGADNGDGTITDNGLVWLKNADCFGRQNLQTATDSTASLNSGKCGLTDKSTAGQWRIPTTDELKRRSKSKSGFNNVRVNYSYWSSSSYPTSTDYAWGVFMIDGYANGDKKTMSLHVWPVRAVQ